MDLDDLRNWWNLEEFEDFEEIAWSKHSFARDFTLGAVFAFCGRGGQAAQRMCIRRPTLASVVWASSSLQRQWRRGCLQAVAHRLRCTGAGDPSSTCHMGMDRLDCLEFH